MIDFDLLHQLYNKSQAKKLEQTLQESLESISPTVTQSDVRSGYITRYFARPVNDKSVMVETNEYNYRKLINNPRFLVVKLKWKIVGEKETTRTLYGAKVLGVEDFNKNSVEQADLTFGGLRRYISDYLQYWFAEE